MSLAEVQRRAKNVFVALDIFLFACACFGNVKYRETASSAAWSCLQDGRWQGRIFVPLIDGVALIFGDTNHCAESWLNEQKFRQFD